MMVFGDDFPSSFPSVANSSDGCPISRLSSSVKNGTSFKLCCRFSKSEPESTTCSNKGLSWLKMDDPFRLRPMPAFFSASYHTFIGGKCCEHLTEPQQYQAISLFYVTTSPQLPQQEKVNHCTLPERNHRWSAVFSLHCRRYKENNSSCCHRQLMLLRIFFHLH